MLRLTQKGRALLLLGLAWGSTLLPLAFFAYFTIETYDLRERTAKLSEEAELLSAKKADLEKQIDDLSNKLQDTAKELQNTANSNAYYRKLVGIRVRYYRPSDAPRAARVATRLGLDVAEFTELGQSTLVSLDPNNLSYGSNIAPDDLIEIALAFLAEGFPLKRIAPATRVQDAKLIQVIASVAADRCRLLTEPEIRTGVMSRTPVICGGSVPLP